MGGLPRRTGSRRGRWFICVLLCWAPRLLMPLLLATSVPGGGRCAHHARRLVSSGPQRLLVAAALEVGHIRARPLIGRRRASRWKLRRTLLLLLLVVPLLRQRVLPLHFLLLLALLHGKHGRCSRRCPVISIARRRGCSGGAALRSSRCLQ